MVVLGIDPGYALMGWGVVEAEGSRMKLVNYGCVETKAGIPIYHRLRTLQLGIRDVFDIYHPDEIAFEELFFSHNATTALMVGAARGAAIIAASEYTENLYEYTPMQIKQAVTGSGRADKKQVQQRIFSPRGGAACRVLLEQLSCQPMPEARRTMLPFSFSQTSPSINAYIKSPPCFFFLPTSSGTGTGPRRPGSG